LRKNLFISIFILTLNPFCAIISTEINKTVRDHPVYKQNYGRFLMGYSAHFSFLGGVFMKKRTGLIVKASLFAAVYIVLTHLQNLLFPTLAWGMIQFRASEAMCILALFTPSAIPGLTVGCLVFNLTSGAALPLDFLLGTLASFLATLCMWLTRRVTLRGFPLMALLFPVIFNAVLVGWELSVYIGGGFILNALCVAAGEAGVMFTLGLLLYYTIKARKLDKKLFF